MKSYVTFQPIEKFNDYLGCFEFHLLHIIFYKGLRFFFLKLFIFFFWFDGSLFDFKV